MDYVTDIAALGMSMSAARFQMDVSLSVAKEAMETQETAAQELMQMLPATGLGDHVDVLA